MADLCSLDLIFLIRDKPFAFLVGGAGADKRNFNFLASLYI